MSNLKSKEECLNMLNELNSLYKIKSQELVACNSLSKEMKIKEEMLKCEVQQKVLKRRLAELESENEISA